MNDEMKRLMEQAEAGDAAAQYNLGIRYVNAEGGERDPSEAFRWCRKAAAQGYPLGELYVGCSYLFGDGVETDEEEGVAWVRRAAEKGLADAQSMLAACYQTGRGVEEDLSEALRLYRLAADQGNANGQVNLGLMYRDGIGVGMDPGQAVNWFRLASYQGDMRGQCLLAESYYRGIGVEKDLKKAVELYEKAAAQGDETALYNLGTCYYRGEGVDEDREKGEKLIRRSAEKGYAPAAEWVARTSGGPGPGGRPGVTDGDGLIDMFLSFGSRPGCTFYDDADYTEGQYREIAARKSAGKKLTVYEECKLIFPEIFSLFGEKADFDKAFKDAERLYRRVETERNEGDPSSDTDFSMASVLLGAVYGARRELVKSAYHLTRGLKMRRFRLNGHFGFLMNAVYDGLPYSSAEDAVYEGCGFSADNPMGSIGGSMLIAWNAESIIPEMEGCAGEAIVALPNGNGVIGRLQRLGSTFDPVSGFCIDVYETFVIDRDYDLRRVRFYFNGYFNGFMDAVRVASGFKISPSSPLRGSFRFLQGE